MTTQINVGTLTDIVHAAGVNFNGLPPDGAISTTPGRIIWAAGVNQGLVSPAIMGISTMLRVVRFQILMTGQDTWSLALVDGADVAVLASGTTEDTYSGEGLATLSSGQALKLTTVGASTTRVKMVCTVIDAAAISPAPK